MSDAIPRPKESDSDDVRLALQTAGAVWSRDSAEALRWLRKAAEGAADAGDDLRSVELARAAADLRSQAGIVPSRPPVAADLAPVPVASATAVPASQRSAAPPPPPPPLPAAIVAQEVAPVWPPPSSPEPAREERPVTQVSASGRGANGHAETNGQLEPRPAQKSEPPSVFPSGATETPLGLGPEDLKRERARREALAFGEGPDGKTEVTSVPPIAARASSIPPDREDRSTIPGTLVWTRRAIQVAVSSAQRDTGRFEVVALAPGQACPAGWTSALLVSLGDERDPFPGH